MHATDSWKEKQRYIKEHPFLWKCTCTDGYTFEIRTKEKDDNRKHGIANRMAAQRMHGTVSTISLVPNEAGQKPEHAKSESKIQDQFNKQIEEVRAALNGYDENSIRIDPELRREDVEIIHPDPDTQLLDMVIDTVSMCEDLVVRLKKFADIIISGDEDFDSDVLVVIARKHQERAINIERKFFGILENLEGA